MIKYTTTKQCPFCNELMSKVEVLQELRDGDQKEIELLMRDNVRLREGYHDSMWHVRCDEAIKAARRLLTVVADGDANCIARVIKEYHWLEEE